MLSAQAEFTKRVTEIEEYIQHLEQLEVKTGFPIGLINTMKSSALLMIYNSVESTMTSLIQDLFDCLHANKVDFNGLNETMQKLILSYSKRRNPDKLVEKMKRSTLSLVVACFEREDVFSGNVDAKKIRETLKEVGVPTRSSYSETVLLKVKSERNDLAHGVKSFSDCGKNYSAVQLRDFHQRTSKVLQQAIGDFESFLNAKAYA